jgi:hypothetical protein
MSGTTKDNIWLVGVAKCLGLSGLTLYKAAKE